MQGLAQSSVKQEEKYSEYEMLQTTQDTWCG